jgi:thiamine pyrophosphate-dependent acetolactate synthase large subunit-like protein
MRTGWPVVHRIPTQLHSRSAAICSRSTCYGIVETLSILVIDALRRNGSIEFIHVRHEEYGVFAAVAEAYLSGHPVAVCGTAGPGVIHLFNGLMDARKEGLRLWVF